MGNRPPLTIDGESGKADSAPLPKLAPIKLDTVRHVREEMARLYREARCGRITTFDATRLAYLLTEIRRCIVDHDFEQRLAALEAAQPERNKT